MDGIDGDMEEPSPSCGDYIMHFLTLFWKILFAFIPPTGNTHFILVCIECMTVCITPANDNVQSISDIYGGYVCFVVSIICIGMVTAVIGDVASHFGCTLGIKDSVTAIVFVALGTSIPGKAFN